MITHFPLITQNKTNKILFILKVFYDIHKYRYILYTLLTISVIEKLTYFSFNYQKLYWLYF